MTALSFVREPLREFADTHKAERCRRHGGYRIAKPLHPHAEVVSGNKYRLATYINDPAGKVYIRHLMTHEEYSREGWKKQ